MTIQRLNWEMIVWLFVLLVVWSGDDDQHDDIHHDVGHHYVSDNDDHDTKTSLFFIYLLTYFFQLKVYVTKKFLHLFYLCYMLTEKKSGKFFLAHKTTQNL